MHDDYQQDLQMIKPLIEAVEFLASQLETLNERLGKVESLVVEDLIGGITNLYKSNQREIGIGSLKEKFGARFEPHMGVLSTFYPGVDIYDRLFETLEKMKGEEGFEDSKFDGYVENVLKELEDKISSIKGVPMEEKSAGDEVLPGTQEAEITIKSEPEKPEEKSESELRLEKLKALKAKAPANLFS